MDIFTKVNTTATKSKAQDVKYTPMVICMLAVFIKTKNMEKVHFIGLVIAKVMPPNNNIRKLSNIKVLGGVVYLTAKDNIKKPTEIFIWVNSKMV